MKSDVYKKRNELIKYSKILRTLSLNTNNYKKSKEISDNQEKLYKKYLFLKKLSEAMEEVKNEKSKTA